jgi:mRNA-degrading endonuclease toxin of MazEF toxin-antitoxin module
MARRLHVRSRLPGAAARYVVRGEVFQLRVPRGARGREQSGVRYAVVVQADELLALSTVLVSPTSTSAPPRSFRPTIDVDGTDGACNRLLPATAAATRWEPGWGLTGDIAGDVAASIRDRCRS